jgi:hypothetical protein
MALSQSKCCNRAGCDWWIDWSLVEHNVQPIQELQFGTPGFRPYMCYCGITAMVVGLLASLPIQAKPNIDKIQLDTFLSRASHYVVCHCRRSHRISLASVNTSIVIIYVVIAFIVVVVTLGLSTWKRHSSGPFSSLFTFKRSRESVNSEVVYENGNESSVNPFEHRPYEMNTALSSYHKSTNSR